MRKRLSVWRKFRVGVVYAWRPAIFIGLLGVFLYFLLWFQLGSLTGGLSPTEATAQRHLALKDISLQSILNNPLYLPYSLILFVLQALGLHGPTALRGVSAVIGTASAIAFYLLIRRWHTPRLAILGTLLFTTSSWFLHTARYGSTDILYVGLLAVILSGVWLQQTKYRRLMLGLVLLSVGLYIYVPGMIWLIVLTAIWQRKRLYSELRRVSRWYAAGLGVGTLITLFPLIWGLIHNPGLIKALLGLPDKIPYASQLLANAINLPVYIFVKGPDDPAVWLPGTAYLDLFSGMMLIIGIYWSLFRFTLDRVRITFGVILFGSALIIIGGLVNPIILMPALYILITAGMTHMLQQWYTVFPRNPIPRSVGTSLLSLAVVFTVYYNLNHYFIAWPHTPSVRNTFISKPLIVD